MIEIPIKLRCPSFRFLRLSPREKIPILEEIAWQVDHNYCYNDTILTRHLKTDGNYGILCGNGLVIIDADSQEVIDICEKELPPTFAVKSGKGKHFYFKIGKDETIKTTPLQSPENPKQNLGHIRSNGAYIVAANSVHPTGKIYSVVNDSEIISINVQQLLNALSFYLPRARLETYPMMKPLSSMDLDISSIYSFNNMTSRGNGEYYGSHFLHGSSTGKNFHINPGKNLWFCFRCNSGGNAFQLFALKEGIISNCGDRLSKEQFKETLSRLRLKIGLRPGRIISRGGN